ncbi:four helix bundle protein [Dyadobacter sp. CY343]|uniref:four helix bundle protein n=1 Tax=Dyadobacter sp. CY343 TaxID=2907299 RepID=UPI001F32B241|nr:four helix bundle protein [Dyadobacter sp. CY343]MCE7061727.1 four helix bundle protein [Dyadobacter sp. CY343]
MQNYQDLKVWQKAHRLVLDIYKITDGFPKTETFGLVSQIRRSGVSVAANLAEGCGKIKTPDIANYFQISLGSLHETEYYILLSKDLEYITSQTFDERNNDLKEIKAMLISLIKTVRASRNTIS